MKGRVPALLVLAALIQPLSAPVVDDESAIRAEAHRVLPRIWPVLGDTRRPPFPEPPQPEPPPAPPPQVEAEIRFCWACDRVELTPENEQALRLLASALPRGSCVEVEGHADRTGGPAINVPLSQRRAEAVADLLAIAGFDVLEPPRFVGQDEPRGLGDAADRRVEVRQSDAC